MLFKSPQNFIFAKSHRSRKFNSISRIVSRSKFVQISSPNFTVMAIEEPIAEPVIVATDAVAPEEKPDVPTAEKPKKVKKPSVKSKPKSPSLHPPYFEMIKDAIITLKERTGSSQYAIAKFIEEKQKNLPVNFKKVLLTQLKKFVAAGKLTKVKASYKLPAKSPATTAPAKKKPAAAKPKIVVKKAPGKKKSVAKPKPAAKLKAVGKPKASAKPKTVVKSKPAAKPKAVAKPSAKSKTAAAAKAKPKTTTPTKPAKVARTSARSTSGKKATAAPKTVSKKTPVKKAAVKSLKPKPAIAKKATATRKAKK